MSLPVALQSRAQISADPNQHIVIRCAGLFSRSVVLQLTWVVRERQPHIYGTYARIRRSRGCGHVAHPHSRSAMTLRVKKAPVKFCRIASFGGSRCI